MGRVGGSCGWVVCVVWVAVWVAVWVVCVQFSNDTTFFLCTLAYQYPAAAGGALHNARCSLPIMCVTVQAFFFPTRLAVAFVISILTVVTFCVLTINVIKSVRNSVSRADAAAIRGIFTGLSSVQKLFYSTTSQEVG